ncbi:FAD-dependent oxidoreductase [Aspergillus affinis]|uniref:FAD-dependent oxidoreductase n=1 Tax=Aspergillus affinis TaxID=1070780 RepID=UPI0022FE8D4B|nr:monooxygenase [Aspergillus affinis]KAI9039122.1 monooxygenase [Aspergillus affinis]
MRFNMVTNPEVHVLIIGAGITDLILAQSLRKAGIRYSIFEKEIALNYRSNEWTMAIHWALDRLQALLPEEGYRALNEVSCNPAIPIDAGGRYPVIHGETGSILAAVLYEKELRVPRSRMRALYAEGILVQYGKKLIDVAFAERGGMMAFFEDGTIESGTIFIGADGPRSTVREFAMKSVKKAARAQTLAEPARSAFTWLPDDTRANKADISFWVSQPWDNRDGRITLVRDAAHPMPPYRGQGLNHCICDVSNLLEGLQNVVDGKSVFSHVITAYEKEMVPRGREEVTCSVENGYMLHDWKKVRESAVFTKGFKPMDGHDSGRHEGTQPGDATDA